MPDVALESGLVVAAYGRRGILEAPDGEQIKYLVKGRRLHVVCGDRVEWVRDRHDGKAIVSKIDNRNNELLRNPADRTEPETLAANLSCVIVVIAPIPVTDWYLMAWDAFQAEQFPFDEARKLAIALGLEMDDLRSTKKIVAKKGQYVVLQKPKERRKRGMVDPEVTIFENQIVETAINESLTQNFR